MITYQQVFPCKGRGIPRLAIQRCESGQLDLFVRVDLEQNHFAILGHDNNVITAQQNLPVPEAAVLPFQFAVLPVDAGEDAIVHSEDVILVRNQIGKLGLHAAGMPEFTGGKGFAGSFDLNQLAAVTVAQAEQDLIVVQDQGHGDVGVAGIPLERPNDRAILRQVGGQAVLVENQDLLLAMKRDEAGGTVAGATAAARPNRFSGGDIVGEQRLAVVAAGTDDYLVFHNQW